MKVSRILYSLSGSTALVLALCASKCEHSTEIIPYVKEICNDVVDNDTDGKTDCQDSDCDTECEVHVQIDPVPTLNAVDTAEVTGSHFKATSILVSVKPSGSGGAATITGDRWKARVSQLGAAGDYVITAIATDAQGRSDTAAFTVTRQN